MGDGGQRIGGNHGRGQKWGGIHAGRQKTQLDRREVEYVVLHATEMVRFGCDGVEKRHTRDGPTPEVDFFAPQFQCERVNATGRVNSGRTTKVDGTWEFGSN